jgi:hypothetical protein
MRDGQKNIQFVSCGFTSPVSVILLHVLYKPLRIPSPQFGTVERPPLLSIPSTMSRAFKEFSPSRSHPVSPQAVQRTRGDAQVRYRVPPFTLCILQIGSGAWNHRSCSQLLLCISLVSVCFGASFEARKPGLPQNVMGRLPTPKEPFLRISNSSTMV